MKYIDWGPSSSLEIPKNTDGILVAIATANVSDYVKTSFTGTDYTSNKILSFYSYGGTGSHFEFWQISTGDTSITANLKHDSARSTAIVFLY